MTTSTPRVAATRARQQAMGLKRIELLAHPDDAAQLKTLADTLQRARRGQTEARDRYETGDALRKHFRQQFGASIQKRWFN